MKTRYKIWMVFSALFFIAGPSRAAAVWVHAATQEKAAISLDKERLEKARVKLDKNREKYERRMERMERRMKKRGLAVEQQSQEVWEDDKFRLGVLLLLVAIGLGLIGAIISLGGLFSFMAGLFALAGIILLIWSLVEYYG